MPDPPEVPEYEPSDGVSRLEELTIAIHDQLADSTVERMFGRNAKSKQTQARRIVWIPMGGQLIPPRQGGGRLPADGTQFRIQSCQDRQARFAAHIYARTYEEAEALLDRVIAAIMLVIPNVTWPAPYEDKTHEDKNEAGVTRRTELIVLHVQTRLPVPDEVKPLRTITGTDHVCGTIQGDGTVKPQEG